MKAEDKRVLKRIDQRYNGAYGGNTTIARVRKLLYMAQHDIAPSGMYGDAECNLWSEFKYTLNRKE